MSVGAAAGWCVDVVLLPHGADLGLPTRASAGAAGYDLRAAVAESITLAPGERKLIPCGFCIAIPDGWEIQVRPRSGLAIRHGITLINSPGTIDADYRGEVMVPLVNFGQAPFVIARGERIAQMIFARFIAPELVIVPTLSATARGVQGFGSTGR
jgi:dUTP pyrophosphatase